jgi:hypothetical protein
VLHAREQQVEVVLQQVFQQARGDGHPQVDLRVLAPPMHELPNRLRLGLNKSAHSDDRLPPRIAISLRRGRSRKEALGAGDHQP